MKLTLVVTCTDRKSRVPVDTLRVRNLPQGSLTERACAWRQSLDAAADPLPLRQLYQGEAWSQVARLENQLVTLGYKPELYVASAGLGLRQADSAAPSYAATFAPRQPDSVASSVALQRDWWRLINVDLPALSEVIADGPAVIVASEVYASAMHGALVDLTSSDDVLMFGGSATSIPAERRVAPDLGLRPYLGGTANSLNIRTAIAWFSRLQVPILTSPEVRSDLGPMDGSHSLRAFVRSATQE